MAERRVTIVSRVGLHARPAAIFVKAASEQPVKVWISKPDAGVEPVEASSILGVMALGAEFGDEVVISAEGAGAEQSLEELAALLSRELDPR